jgi:hypothetical protein
MPAGKENVPPDFDKTSGAMVVGSLAMISPNGKTIISPVCLGITPGMAATDLAAVGAVPGPDAGAGIRSSFDGEAVVGGVADLEKSFFKASNMDRAEGILPEPQALSR